MSPSSSAKTKVVKTTKTKAKAREAKVMWSRKHMVFRVSTKEGRGKKAKTYMRYVMTADISETTKRAPRKNKWPRMLKRLMGIGTGTAFKYYTDLVKFDPTIREWENKENGLVDIEKTIKNAQRVLVELKLIMKSSGYDLPEELFNLEVLDRTDKTSQLSIWEGIEEIQRFKRK
jgi:hypothetical protein